MERPDWSRKYWVAVWTLLRLTASTSQCTRKLLLHSRQRTTRLQLHSTPVPQSECLCRDSRALFGRDYSPCVVWWLIFVLIFTLHKVQDFWMVFRRNCLGSTSQHRKDYVIKELIRRHLCGSESGKGEDQRWVLLRDSSLIALYLWNQGHVWLADRQPQLCETSSWWLDWRTLSFSSEEMFL